MLEVFFKIVIEWKYIVFSIQGRALEWLNNCRLARTNPLRRVSLHTAHSLSACYYATHCLTPALHSNYKLQTNEESNFIHKFSPNDLVTISVPKADSQYAFEEMA